MATRLEITAPTNILNNTTIGTDVLAGGQVSSAKAFTGQNRSSYLAGLNVVNGTTDMFYGANNRTDFWYHSVAIGSHQFSNWESGCLYNGEAAGGFTWSVNTYPVSASSPLVIQICSGNDENGYKYVEHSDVLTVMLHAHRLTVGSQFFVSYKVEVLCKPGYDSSTLPASDVSWYTIFEKTNVHDDVQGLTFKPDNSAVMGAGYCSVRGIRITVTALDSGGDEYFRIGEIQLLNHRGGGVPANAVGAIPLTGGPVYGNMQTQYLTPRLGWGTYTVGTHDEPYGGVYAITMYPAEIRPFTAGNNLVIGSGSERVEIRDQFFPWASNTYDIGGPWDQWKNIYANKLYLGATGLDETTLQALLAGGGGSSLGHTLRIADADSDYDIMLVKGDGSIEYRTIHSGEGTKITDVYAVYCNGPDPIPVVMDVGLAFDHSPYGGSSLLMSGATSALYDAEFMELKTDVQVYFQI